MAAALTRNSRVFVTSFSSLVRQCCCPNISLNCSRIQLRYKGHSQWQNRKFKKADIDFARSKEFGKLSIEMITAVRESGADVRSNSRLEKLIERARSISMPKINIENAIKTGTGTKGNPYEASLLEVKGPGGCGLLVQLLTANKIKTKCELNTILRKNGGLFKDGGSLTFHYDHKGMITVEDFIFTEDKHKSPDYPDDESIDKAEEVAIECGAENLFFCESENGVKHIKFICAVEDTKQVHDDLSAKFPNRVLLSELEYIPRTLVSLSDEPLQQAEKLIDTLEEHLDVMRVYDNIEQYPSTTCKLFGST
ncbi:hypothetical protein OS493_026929 [Desmophyllum pertusum]|uniref:Translational activator of cytochrome c oxidase 1 n=1 Tax=Desmophyllum pertusum TaxID=174260 RepID=A0A9W9YXL2_9CNID|nr:hypothetical protein OS493_026929 [Desmophyllum pertusum]